MRLLDVVAEYVAYKRALGMRFDTDADILGAFCRCVAYSDEIGHPIHSKSATQSKANRPPP